MESHRDTMSLGCFGNLLSFFAKIMVLVFLLLASPQSFAQGKEPGMLQQNTVYRTVQVDGLSIFYREAGPQDAPPILLLHGLPSSSRMFEPLFARLSDKFHMIAPDYPGFGHSDAPDPKQFAYTFDHLATIMEHFTEKIGLTHYTAVHAGLRRPGGIPHDSGASRTRRRADRAGRGGA